MKHQQGMPPTPTALNDRWAKTRTSSLPNVWLRMTSSGWKKVPVTLEERELARRSRLASWVIFGLVIADLVLIPGGLAASSTLIAIIVVFSGLLVAAVFNRSGHVTAAGIVLFSVISSAIVFAIASVPHLSLIYLPAYDMFVVSTLVAASILPLWAVFPAMFTNVGFMVADFFAQPHSADLEHAVATYGVAAMLERPIAVQVIVAVVAYLWVRGTQDAIRRADRAEEIGALEHSIAEQKRQLDIGVQQILQTHVRAANGDFSARAPLGTENVLWQISASLNNLLARLQRAGQAEHQLHRTEEELRRLATAIDDANAGRSPIWPAATGTAADLIVERINRGPRPSSAYTNPLDLMNGNPRTPAGAPPSQGWVPPFSGPSGPSAPLPPLPFFDPSIPRRDEYGQEEPGRSPANPWIFPTDADERYDR